MSANADIVRSIYEAAIKGDINAIMPVIDPQITIYEAASLPYGGEYHGHEGFSRLVTAVFTSWAAFEVDLKELFDAGSTIIAILQIRVTLKESGRVVEMPVAEFWRLRDGKVVDLRPFYWDTAELRSNA
ncbi:MAG: nuclear transport factor 2 family protein [Polyangiaceae bacterium]|nr:nuclear transport factor 2 family protein [Polyangiaceae bacterium]NUQ78324.1 nuclear transport factor 2 family protein [Polyangiaceae bacterium]